LVIPGHLPLLEDDELNAGDRKPTHYQKLLSGESMSTSGAAAIAQCTHHEDWMDTDFMIWQRLMNKTKKTAWSPSGLFLFPDQNGNTNP
jgi:hypothetical protein